MIPILTTIGAMGLAIIEACRAAAEYFAYRKEKELTERERLKIRHIYEKAEIEKEIWKEKVDAVVKMAKAYLEEKRERRKELINQIKELEKFISKYEKVKEELREMNALTEDKLKEINDKIAEFYININEVIKLIPEK